MRFKASDAIAFLAIIIVIVALSAYALAATIGEGIRVLNEPVEVKISILNGNKIRLGDVVTLCANMGGVRGGYTLNWQTDGGTGEWRAVDTDDGSVSADGLLYAFQSSKENIKNRYRVLLVLD